MWLCETALATDGAARVGEPTPAPVAPEKMILVTYAIRWLDSVALARSED